MEVWGVPPQDLNTALFVWWYSTLDTEISKTWTWLCSFGDAHHHLGDWEQQHLDRLAGAWDLTQPGSYLVTSYRRKGGPLQQRTYERVDLLLSGIFRKVSGIIRECRFACFLNFFFVLWHSYYLRWRKHRVEAKIGHKRHICQQYPMQLFSV